MDEYRIKGGLSWRGLFGLPTRVSSPLAAIVVTPHRIDFYALGAQKYSLAKGEVTRIDQEAAFMVYRLKFEHDNASVATGVKFGVASQPDFEKLKENMTAMGWVIS